jgi:hypothetical protein
VGFKFSQIRLATGGGALALACMSISGGCSGRVGCNSCGIGGGIGAAGCGGA